MKVSRAGGNSRVQKNGESLTETLNQTPTGDQETAVQTLTNPLKILP